METAWAKLLQVALCPQIIGGFRGRHQSTLKRSHISEPCLAHNHWASCAALSLLKLLQLNSAEASTLVDACALLLLASRSAPGCALNQDMTALLQTLFEQFSSHSV